MKVLVLGSLKDKELDKLKSMHEKNQFDLCLVVGPVDVDLAQVPLSVYFIGGSTPFEGRMLNSLAKEEQYLGTHGVLTTPEGLRIGYLSGVYDENHYKLPDTPDWFLKHSNYYNQEHIHILEKQDPVDILLTHEWPSHIAESQQVKGQMGPSIVCAKIRPRYHFSFGSFYEREPFWNTTHCTRFISLNQFGKKDRWFYAFNIDPMASMDPDALKQKPPKTTQSPFGDLIEEETNDFFFHSEKKLKKPKSNSDSDIVCRACGGRGHTARKCPESGQNPHALALKRRDPNQCWFCLSNPDVESHLIVSVIQETYLTAAKGGLVNRHTILVPVTHYPSTRALQVMEKEADKANQVLNEIERVRGTIDAIERSNGCFLVSFEIFIGLDPLKPQTRLHHMHIQLVSLGEEYEDILYDKFREQAEKEQLDERDKLPESPFDPFLRVQILGKPDLIFTPPDSSTFDDFDGHKRKRRNLFNLQNPRTVIANLLGKPMRADWKYCVMSQEDETNLTKQLQELYQGLDE